MRWNNHWAPNLTLSIGIAERLQVSGADSPGTGWHEFAGNALSTAADVVVCDTASV